MITSTPSTPSTPSTVRTGLSLAGVTLTFGEGELAVTALNQVDLTVGPGELVAIVGPSGAGKSSLLAVAGGLTRPSSGSVAVDGVELTELSGRRLAAFRREHVGFVFQSGNLVPALTAIDQLRLVEKITGRRGVTPPEQLLATVGMAEHAGRRPGKLSGGERQRVGIARALVASPSLLLVDEPTAALDRRRSHEVVELLAKQTHENAVATVLVTHDHDILEHVDRVLEMVDGQLRPRTGTSAG